MIGGLMKVYEIGKNFRNQSVDQTHNPEFTSCELYCAFATYEDMIKFTYEMINFIARQVNGTSIIETTEGNKIDLSLPWKEVDFMEGLEERLKQKLPTNFENSETLKFYDELC